MATYKGILSFPTLFTPKVAKGADEAKYSAVLLLHPNDPQVPQIQSEVENAKRNGFPSGYTGADECFGTYDSKFQGKEYYDPRFSGYYVLSCTAKADDKPAVVDMNHQPIIDANSACAGAVVYLACGISAYTKGKGGIGGWLNGVMVTNEEMPFGRLDSKPTVEQMFANVGGNPATGGHASSLPQNTAPPTPPPAPNTAPAPPPPPVQFIATAKAQGATVEQMLTWQGWTEELLLQHGYIQKPSFA